MSTTGTTPTPDLQVSVEARTTAITGAVLDLRRARHAAAGICTWGTKSVALTALAVLRERGLNRDRDIEVHRAETHLWRFWVIGRPDHYNGVTYLMTDAGAWVPGRLSDAPPCFCPTRCRLDHGAPWSRLAGDPQPATVTHDYQYSAGQVGLSDGHGAPLVSYGWDGSPVERTTWCAQAWCIACSWSTNDDQEDAVRMRARGHRKHPERYPDHATPRRPLVSGETSSMDHAA